MTAAEVRKQGGPSNTAAILGRDPMGWFVREVRPGGGRTYLYRVGEKGLAALAEYEDILKKS